MRYTNHWNDVATCGHAGSALLTPPPTNLRGGVSFYSADGVNSAIDEAYQSSTAGYAR
jgi:hypothetical protein